MPTLQPLQERGFTSSDFMAIIDAINTAVKEVRKPEMKQHFLELWGMIEDGAEAFELLVDGFFNATNEGLRIYHDIQEKMDGVTKSRAIDTPEQMELKAAIRSAMEKRGLNHLNKYI